MSKSDEDRDCGYRITIRHSNRDPWWEWRIGTLGWPECAMNLKCPTYEQALEESNNKLKEMNRKHWEDQRRFDWYAPKRSFLQRLFG